MINTINRPSHCMFKGIKKINKHIRILPVGTVLYWRLVSFGDLQLIAALSQTPQCYNSQCLHERKGELLVNCQQMFCSLKLKATCIFTNDIDWKMRKAKLHFIIISLFFFIHLLKVLWVSTMCVCSILWGHHDE